MPYSFPPFRSFDNVNSLLSPIFLFTMADFEKPLPPWFSLSETNPGPNALVSAIVFISIAEVASLTKVVTAVLRSGRPRADDYFIIASMVSTPHSDICEDEGSRWKVSAVAYTTFVCLAMVQDPEDDSDGHSGTTFYRVSPVFVNRQSGF